MVRYVVGVDIGTKNMGIALFVDNGQDGFSLVKIDLVNTGITTYDMNLMTNRLRITIAAFLGKIAPDIVVIERQDASMDMMKYTMASFATIIVMTYPNARIILMHSREKFLKMPKTYLLRKQASVNAMLLLLPDDLRVQIVMKYSKLDDIADAFMMGYCFIDEGYKIVCQKRK